MNARCFAMRIIFLLTACGASENELMSLRALRAKIEFQMAMIRFDQWCEKHFQVRDEEHLCSAGNAECQKGIMIAAHCLWKNYVHFLSEQGKKPPAYNSESWYWVMYKCSWMHRSFQEWEKYHHHSTEKNKLMPCELEQKSVSEPNIEESFGKANEFIPIGSGAIIMTEPTENIEEPWSVKMRRSKDPWYLKTLPELTAHHCLQLQSPDPAEIINDQKYAAYEAEMQFNIIKDIGQMSKSKLQEMLKNRKWNTSGDMKALCKKLRRAMQSEENVESEPVYLHVKRPIEKIAQKEETSKEKQEKNMMELTKIEIRKKLTDLGVNYQKKDNLEKLRKRLQSGEEQVKKGVEKLKEYGERFKYFLSFVHDGHELLDAVPVVTGSKDGFYQSRIRGRQIYFVYKTKTLYFTLIYEENPFRLFEICKNIMVYKSTKDGEFTDKKNIYLLHESVKEDEETQIITQIPFKAFLVTLNKDINEIPIEEVKIISFIKNELTPGYHYDFETSTLIYKKIL